MPVQFRRKREGKTNYNRRRKLLGGREPRVIIRKSNTNVYLQIAKYEEKGDKIITNANSRELLKIGWKGARKNLPAAYLTGLLLASKAKKQNIKKAILDVGMHTPTPGGIIYAALKGLVDGGIHVPHSEEVIPKQERIEGKHIMLNPKSKSPNKEKIAEQFNETKNKILKE